MTTALAKYNVYLLFEQLTKGWVEVDGDKQNMLI
jgi:hypothetical protein